MISKIFTSGYKKILIVTLFIMLSIYSIKSVKYLFMWNSLQKEKINEYKLLLDKKKTMQNEIEVLRVKVEGLREPTLNKEILEIQAKSLINSKRANEILVVN